MRRRFMRGLVAIVAGPAVAAFAVAATAQETDSVPPVPPSDGQIIAPLLTVDIEELFTQSMFGQRIARRFTQERETLATENRRIAEALREEELALTEQRASMAPDIFRTEAEAFDTKTQAIRRAQDAKESALNDMIADGREQFLNVTRPILGQLMIDFGAVAILDRRSVLLSLSSVDITDVAVARIDDAIGDGTSDADEPAPVPDVAPEPALEVAPEPTSGPEADPAPDISP